ncbi:MAG: TonB-dependent receptor [Chitinophagaceae bacterium]
MGYRNAHIIFSVCFLLVAGPTYAQTIKINGTIKDQWQAIPFASVQLKSIDDTTFHASAWADTAGFYLFEKLKKDRYKILVSALGYKDYTSNSIEVNKDQTFDIELKAEHKRLQDIAVASKKKVFETDKGKLIFNIQNSALTTGQTALDMLKKLPGVSVGQNDQILFRGSSGINIMINGKPTYLSGSQLANFLMGMSAEDINKIEFLATPSAAFDAAGNAGIINIVPKKNLKKGYAIDLRSSVSKGKYWMTNENISTSLRTEKVNIYGSFDFNTPNRYSDDKSGNAINENGNIFHLDRANTDDFKVKYYTWQAGADWQFWTKHNISVSYHGYLDDFKSYQYSVVDKTDNSGSLESYLNTHISLVEPYHYGAVSADYRFDIDSLGKKITVDANHTSYRNFSDGLMDTKNYAANGDFLHENIQKYHQPGFVKIASVKADADLPFETFTLKTGAKYAEVKNDNQYRFDSLQSGNYIAMEAISNHFKYRERITAVYFSASKKIRKTNMEAGLRMEYNNADGYTVKQDIANKWKYAKWFPSLAIGQMISDGHKIDFSFSRRINRPSYADLNPVRWYNDPYFYFSGNPNLVPELAWVYAFTYSLKSKYIFSATYNQSNNFIDRRLSIDDNGTTIKSMSDNFGKRHRFDFTTSVPFKLGTFWDIQLFTDLNHTSYPISLLSGEKHLSRWSVTTTLQQDFILPKDFTLNLATYFYSSELRGIYITRPTGFLNFGIKNSFFDKKLMAQFSVSDIFNSNRYKATSQTDVTNYYYNDKPYSSVLGLSLKYHFGGELIKSSSKKTEEQDRL